MHHYGEKFTTSKVYGDTFEIQCTNHVSGAVITLSGPVRGVFESGEEVMDEGFAHHLGIKFAHFLKQNLMGGPAASTPRQARA
jgi:hypothetical protein